MSRIVVTVGPATQEPAVLEQVVKAGADSFRFPASKASVASLADLASSVSSVAAGFGRTPDLLLDLPGSKTRFTNDDQFSLAGISRVRVHFGPVPSDVHRDVPVLGLTGSDISGQVDPGDIILIGDGEDALRVERVESDHCVAIPLSAGFLGKRRGVALPGKSVSSSGLTDKDRAALETLPGSIFSAVIISFVESADSVREARDIMAASAAGEDVLPVIAKVETRAGAAAVREIAECADAVLLGRGDLLLDSGPLEFFDLCETVRTGTAEVGCPLIVGTQLLTSLSAGWMPHRSELAYVSGLLRSGTAGLMLADETAAGTAPVRTVELLRELRERYTGSTEVAPLFSARTGAAPGSGGE
ncbi:pyruvate kinase [Streptomyces sp. NBC_01136]|uniref:pyruvate kinase n=1 Tax=unclassified Streptomyces TaxID=2593676 RepID=UPI00324CDE83|nr:pyruvate kinase [Streptomyces sp. NBC_01136]